MARQGRRKERARKPARRIAESSYPWTSSPHSRLLRPPPVCVLAAALAAAELGEAVKACWPFTNAAQGVMFISWTRTISLRWHA
jgi:hypothetical protein